MAAQELRWLTYLLTDLGEQPRSPPVLYVDNKAMLALCREHRLEHRTKHIALRYFLARELQQRGQLRLAYVASEANTADIFTKALAPGDHQRFCTLLDCVVFLLVPNSLLVHSFLFLHMTRRSIEVAEWWYVSSSLMLVLSVVVVVAPLSVKSELCVPPRGSQPWPVIFLETIPLIVASLDVRLYPLLTMVEHLNGTERNGEHGGHAHRQPPVVRSEAVTGLDLLFSSIAEVNDNEKPPDPKPPDKIPFEHIDEEGWCASPTAPVTEQDSSPPPAEKLAPEPVTKKSSRYMQSRLPWFTKGADNGATPPSPADQRSSPMIAGPQESPSVPGYAGKCGKGGRGASDVQTLAFKRHAATTKHKEAVKHQEKLIAEAGRKPRINGDNLARDTEKERVIALCDSLLFALGIELAKISGMSTDGASVMMGSKNGLVARLRLRIPHLVSSHCIAHREALTAKDAADAIPEFDMVDGLIRQVAEYLGRSSPWHQRFLELQELFTATNLELKGIHQFRWLSRGDAVLRTVAVFPAFIVMLSEWDETLYQLATSYRFHFLLFFLADVLEQLNMLNKSFQQREVSNKSFQRVLHFS
ncbi:unnamed protein product [Closterium sp. NIES-54]